MKKIIFVCVVVAIATLTSCEKKEAARSQVTDQVYTEAVEGGFYVVNSYGDGQFSAPLTDKIYDKVVFDKPTDLIFAYKGRSFDIFTKDGNARGEGGYEGYKVDGDIVHFAKGDMTMLYSKRGVVIGTFATSDFVVDHGLIFTKNPKGLWSLRDLNGDYLTDVSYEKIYIIDLKDDGSFDKLCYRDGWSLTGSDGGAYDKSSTEGAVKALKKKNPTVPVGVVDI